MPSAFIGNFIIISGGFHWEFHYYPWGISLGISLFSLGYFIGNFIIIPGRFHCDFIIFPWDISYLNKREFHNFARSISLQFHNFILLISLSFS